MTEATTGAFPRDVSSEAQAKPSYVLSRMTAIFSVACFCWWVAEAGGGDWWSRLWQWLGTLGEHWITTLLYLLLLFAIGGRALSGMGLGNLFHEDAAMKAHNTGRNWWWNSPTLFGAAAAAVFAVYFVAVLIVVSDTPRPAIPRVWQDHNFLVYAAAFATLSVYLLPAPLPRRQPGNAQHLRALVGTLLGLVVGYAVLWIASVVAGYGWFGWTGLNELFAMALAFTVAAALPSLFILLPAVAVTLLIFWASLAVTVLNEFGPVAPFLAMVAAVLIIWFSSSGFARLFGSAVPLKFRFPGIVTLKGEDRIDHYDDILKLEEVLPDSFFADREKDMMAETQKRYATSTEMQDNLPGTDAVDPLGALKAWKERRGVDKPKLVLIATSGGAYRAGFWTALVLDRLLREVPTLAADTRLITGASGGMVGAAYFAALLERKPDGLVGLPDGMSLLGEIEKDILSSQTIGDPEMMEGHGIRYPIPRDSLSPVVRQLMGRDLRMLVRPGTASRDRGTELENQWKTLDVDFKTLCPGEAEGWRPSLVFSPMIVETGQPLLIGNLDMAQAIAEDERNETASFFEWFPHSRDTFKVKTAVRMNASFPYVSPSTALPTEPYLRVVDAGYYDNYGIDAAMAYLSRPAIQRWIAAECSGIALIEIRAFPSKRLDKNGAGAIARAFQWATTPLDGILAARSSTMTFRNRQSMGRQKRVYEDATGVKDFFRSFRFEVDSNTSLSWYMPEEELVEMQRILDGPDIGKRVRELADFL
ncbi:hypothetical protein [Algicella marina]|uniref:PNPLA domain-containing protein n=1 Tax=Algicella marina TaxID=2683284 RepID=A0A6P1STJ6_9RHOB|nr:hypothetical protein [Algicella marina]QHQ34004.1 hypothetical protein GO499_01795 [Algicella marina]